MAIKLGNFLFILLSIVSLSAIGQDSLGLRKGCPERVSGRTGDRGASSDYFFNSANRYEENSAYDWLDIVNAYLSKARNSRDSTAIRKYQLMQAQLYYDLGDFDKSIAIATELHGSINRQWTKRDKNGCST